MTDFKAIVESSYDNGTPFWIYTSDYIFGMVPVDASGTRWKEISYTFEEPENPLFVTKEYLSMLRILKSLCSKNMLKLLTVNLVLKK